MQKLTCALFILTMGSLAAMEKTSVPEIWCTIPDENALEKLLRDEQVAFFISPLKKIAGKTMGISQFLEAVDAAVCEESLTAVTQFLHFQRCRVLGVLLKHDPQALQFIANKELVSQKQQ